MEITMELGEKLYAAYQSYIQNVTIIANEEADRLKNLGLSDEEAQALVAAQLVKFSQKVQNEEGA